MIIIVIIIVTERKRKLAKDKNIKSTLKNVVEELLYTIL